MGGPRAWKEMQKRQQEFQNQWDQDDVINQNREDDADEEDAEGKHVEKRDIYAEYDIDPETENEKSQRAPGLGDTGENPGEEDVGLVCAQVENVADTFAGIHNGYDAQDTECRPGSYWVRQARTEMG
jgi:hypothetical protein